VPRSARRRHARPVRARVSIIAAASVQRLLRHLSEPALPPVLAPARGPPFFKTRAVRRKLGAIPLQAQLFDA